MKYVIDFGTAKVEYKSLDKMDENIAKLFQLMIHLRAKEMNKDKITYRIVRKD